MPLVPIAAATLPNGKVLMWSTDQENGYGPSLIQSFTGLYDPATGQTSSRLITNTGHNMVRPGEEMITNTSDTSPDKIIWFSTSALVGINWAFLPASRHMCMKQKQRVWT